MLNKVDDTKILLYVTCFEKIGLNVASNAFRFFFPITWLHGVLEIVSAKFRTTTILLKIRWPIASK